MSTEETVRMLDELHNQASILIALQEKAGAEKRALLTPEQKAKFVTIDQCLAADAKTVALAEKVLRAEIKAAVIASSEKVRGTHFQAIPTTRTKWNGKGLDGYAVANPDILAFRSESKSVTIRKT